MTANEEDENLFIGNLHRGKGRRMPKPVKMMVLDSCPYCQQAFQMMEELRQAHPEYRTVEIEVIEENREPEKIEGYEYWYVPTFFVDGVKVHEGVPTMEKVEHVFQEALNT